MNQEAMCEQWLKVGQSYEKRYYICLGLAFASFTGCTILNLFHFHMEWIKAVLVALLPYCFFWMIGQSWNQESEECKERFERQVPFIEVCKRSWIVYSLEFRPNELHVHYQSYDGGTRTVKVPLRLVKFYPTMQSDCTVQYRYEKHNLDQTIQWNYVNLYLTPDIYPSAVAMSKTHICMEAEED